MIKNKKAFIFSTDALIAIALVILLTYIFLLQPQAKNPAIQLNVLSKTILHDYALVGFYNDKNATGLIEMDIRYDPIYSNAVIKDAKLLNLVQSMEQADENTFAYCAFYYNYDLNSGEFWISGTKGKVERKDICNGVS